MLLRATGQALGNEENQHQSERIGRTKQDVRVDERSRALKRVDGSGGGVGDGDGNSLLAGVLDRDGVERLEMLSVVEQQEALSDAARSVLVSESGNHQDLREWRPPSRRQR